MHPPFIFTDHKVGPHPFPRPDGKPPRRNQPCPLDLTPVAGWPPVPLVAPTSTLPLSPSGQPMVAGLRLQVVPPPRRSLRDFIGRWLIRTGQRMIMTQRAG
ncbi:hypothetical protein [Yoonia sp. 208BN28-4]|uniref:hypothetical protein n=1 Tax=Yoonia sp. 208BN28-4 TaxID=3126505 RepID=UPI00309D2A94